MLESNGSRQTDEVSIRDMLINEFANMGEWDEVDWPTELAELALGVFGFDPSLTERQLQQKIEIADRVLSTKLNVSTGDMDPSEYSYYDSIPSFLHWLLTGRTKSEAKADRQLIR